MTGRYHRQQILTHFGAAGQQRLAEARVLVIGAGGLGCPALQYLAGAGVGKLGIVDGDRVSLSNLHRQPLFATADVGALKAEVAAERMRALNPTIQLQAYSVYLDEQNAEELLAEYDYVLDGSDNFATRYLINDACVLAQKPLVYGAVSQYEGQVAIWNVPDTDGNCLNYRDLFPEAPRSGEIPNCSEAGVLGVLPGIIGAMQAAELIKLITGIGRPLINRLLTYSLLNQESYILDLASHPTSKALLPADWSAFRQGNYGVPCASPVAELDVAELQRMLAEEDLQLVDVREVGEEPAISVWPHQRIPLSVLPAYWDNLSDQPVVFICQSGIRSLKAATDYRAAKPGARVYSLRGGVYSLEN